MSETLVVIDMQEAFHAAHNKLTQRNVVREIKAARKRKAGIVLVEYDSSGDTVPPVWQALKGYGNLDVVEKYHDNGAPEIVDSIYSNYFNSEALLVCGVNTDACVCDTVEGLSQELPKAKIKVVADACNTTGFNNFHWVDYLPNVTLVEREMENWI